MRVVPVPDSKLVDVFFTGSDAAFAAKAANALVDEYVAQNLEVKLQSTQNMLEWLEREVAAQQKKVEQSERELGGLPRSRERDVAGRQEQHRPVAAERAERRRAPGPHSRIEKEAHRTTRSSSRAGAVDDLR